MCGENAPAVVSDEPAEGSKPVDERRQSLRRRLRAEWIAGAEEQGRARRGRPMTAAELDRVLKRYPGDL